ncbi:hypothetical protein, partial [Paenibacillus hemerocallicola]|uniref:hypothetical protein n=1 Tax=Paenibacillus hemerocallicola TaxID=1172614 RepID=UPI001C402EFE
FSPFCGDLFNISQPPIYSQALFCIPLFQRLADWRSALWAEQQYITPGGPNQVFFYFTRTASIRTKRPSNQPA